MARASPFALRFQTSRMPFGGSVSWRKNAKGGEHCAISRVGSEKKTKILSSWDSTGFRLFLISARRTVALNSFHTARKRNKRNFILLFWTLKMLSRVFFNF